MKITCGQALAMEESEVWVDYFNRLARITNAYANCNNCRKMHNLPMIRRVRGRK